MKPKKNNNKINKRNWPMILIENIKSGMIHIETLLLMIMMIFALNHELNTRQGAKAKTKYVYWCDIYGWKSKHVHVDFSVNVIQTAEYQKYMRIKLYVNFVWRGNRSVTDG